jgi:type IV secretory pathway VirB2 component (pilin)
MKYISRGFKSVEACSIRAAVVIFAERAARKQFGKSGRCETFTQIQCSVDGRFAEYSVFIGCSARGRRHEAGHNQFFLVYAAGPQSLKKGVDLCRKVSRALDSREAGSLSSLR